EEAIVGMKPGTTKTVILPPSKTFGERRDDLFFPLPRSQFPQDTIIVGELIDIPAPDGSTLTGRVRLVDDYMVVVDLNNPLAGHELIYEISLLSIEQAS
ncbi:MAG: peptidylprolyl isomerase, partial [Candidatus Dadabacteria bacterium]